jgi:sphingomyelin phosphodiesterase
MSNAANIRQSLIASLVNKVECGLCNTLIPVARSLVKKDRTTTFRSLAVQICLVLKISNDKKVCDQTVSIFEEIAFEVLRESTLTDQELCSVFLKCQPINNPVWNWNITMPNVPKPPVVAPKLPDVCF